MSVRREVIPFIIASFVTGGVLAGLLYVCRVNIKPAVITGAIVFAVLACYMIYFFRDPERDSPTDASKILSGADGTIAAIVEMDEQEYLKTNTVRVSIFLSLFDVHVNRAPISGKSRFLGYFKGRHLFTFTEKSSDVNQHNKILITGRTRCLVTQIVGPVCRRVVYWPDHNNDVDIKMGDRIGMMKFGSRMDMYFPKDEVTITAKIGDRVHAGLTVVGTIKEKAE